VSSPRGPLSLVLDYQRTAKTAFNVLAGTLAQEAETRAVPVHFVTRGRSLAVAVADALERSERVLVLRSFYSPEQDRVFAARALERTAPPDARVLHIAGGVHATAEPRATLEAGFDLVAVGEGERTILDLVRALVAGDDPRRVRGIASLDGGALRSNGKGEAVDLNAFPPFALEHGRIGPIEITRGCIYACKFCQTPSMNRARFRHRTVENVQFWVRKLKEQRVRDYRFVTPTSLSYGTQDTTPCLEAVERLLASVREIVGREARVFFGTFPSEIRPEHVTPEALALIARYADNRSIIIGGQSGSERILGASRRGHSVDEVERAACIALASGFEPHVDFIFGLPGEEPDDTEATLRLAERLVELGALVHGHTFLPLPGTPWRREAPGALAPAARARVARLASRQKLYGQWESQGRIAQDLARQLKGRADGPSSAPGAPSCRTSRRRSSGPRR
jgi:B12-binding domain/radical SAM domain protein